MRVLPLGASDQPPLDPDAGPARQWLREELARPEYTDDVTWQERLDRWLAQRMPDGLDVGGSVLGALAVVLLILVTVAVIAWQVRSFRAGTRRQQEGRDVFEETTLSAAEHRAVAERASSAGDFDTAVREYFRAIARSLEERTIISERPGRTAHEVALEAGTLLPDHVGDLRAAADSFDAVVYGKRRATTEAAQRMRDSDSRVGQARVRHLVSSGSEPAA